MAIGSPEQNNGAFATLSNNSQGRRETKNGDTRQKDHTDEQKLPPGTCA